MWAVLAVGSAVFAALTSVLAKIGVEKIDSNLATAVRTFVVLNLFLGNCIRHRRTARFGLHLPQKPVIFDPVRFSHRRVMALLLSRHSAWRRCKGCSHR